MIVLANTTSSQWLLRFLQWIGVDSKQLSPDGELHLEAVNAPENVGVLVVPVLLLVCGLIAVILSRKQLDLWRPAARFGLMAGSVAAFCLLVLLGGMVTQSSLQQSWMSDKTVVFAALAGCAFWVPWLYRWENDTVSLNRRLALGALRIGVLVLMALIWIAPEIVPFTEKALQRTVILLRDKTQSMLFQDTYRDNSPATIPTAAAMKLSPDDLRDKKLNRVNILDHVLAVDDHKLVREILKRGKVIVMDFDDTLTKPFDPLAPLADKTSKEITPVSNTDKDGDPTRREIILPPLTADGRGSDLYLAIHEALTARSPSAIVIFTDGQHTGQEDPKKAAEEALAQNVKLYIVGIGDSSRPRNLRIDNVYAQPNVGTKDKFEVAATLSAQDINGETVTLELIEQKINTADGQLGPEKVVKRIDQLINKPKLSDIKFEHEQQEPGKYVYSVKVTQLDDESDENDNHASSSPVNVLQKDNLKVLLVAGAPTWEYRLVQKLLTREDSIHLSCWLQTLDEDRMQDGDADSRIKELPRQLTAVRDIPGLNEYGVVLMFDPDPKEFDQQFITTLKQYVGEHAGGLLYMAGPKFTAPFLSNPRTSDIRELLPVRFGDVAALEVMGLMSMNNRPYPLRVVPPNIDHDMLQFYNDNAENQRRWEGLPGIFWSFPAIGPKPTAQVLLEHSDTSLRTSEGYRPLLVSGRYGAGNTAYLGFNGTWRWRQMGREAEFFDKFWIKAVKHLADERSSKGRRYGSLATSKDRYEVGEKIEITARLRDASYEWLKEPEVDATLASDASSPLKIVLKPVAGQDGMYQGFATARATGVHRLSVDIPAAEGVKPTVDDKNFTVELPRVEMNQQWLNKPLLTELATMTGGKYFELNELDQLAPTIPDQTEIISERGAPTSLWNLNLWNTPVTIRWLLFFMLFCLLTTEWACRKAFKLL